MTVIDVVDGDLPVGDDILVVVKAGSSRRVSGVEKQADVLPDLHAFRRERRARHGRRPPQLASNVASPTAAASPFTRPIVGRFTATVRP